MEKTVWGSGRLAGGRAEQRGFICRLLIRASSANTVWLGNCQEPVSHSDFCTGQTLSSGDGSIINQVRPHLSSGCPSHREGLCAMKKASEKAGRGWPVQPAPQPPPVSQTSQPWVIDFLLCKRLCELSRCHLRSARVPRTLRSKWDPHGPAPHAVWRTKALPEGLQISRWTLLLCPRFLLQLNQIYSIDRYTVSMDGPDHEM